MRPLRSTVRRLVLPLCLCDVGVLVATPLRAKASARYRVALGALQQTTASVSDKGWTIGFHRAFPLSAISALELGIDFARSAGAFYL